LSERTESVSGGRAPLPDGDPADAADNGEGGGRAAPLRGAPAAVSGAEEELARRYAELTTLHDLAGAVARAETLEEVYDAAIDGIVRTLGVERASILVFDEAGVMRFRAWRGLSDAYRAAVDGHSPWTRDSVDACPIHVEDVRAEESLGELRDTILGEGIEACAFVPLVHRGRVVGKFMLYHREPHVFTEDELRLAQTVAGHVAAAVARRLAEEELRRSRDQLEIIFRGVADGITVQGPNGRLVYANDAAVEFLGFESFEDLLAASSILERFDLLDEAGVPLDRSRLPGRRALTGERPPAQTVGWRIKSSGETRWSIARAAPVFGPAGDVLYAVNIFRDVTENRLRELERDDLLNRIELERELLEAVLRQMPAGVMIAEAPSGRLILGNDQVEAIWRHPFLAAAEVGDYDAYRGFHHDGRPYEPSEWPLARAIAQGEVVQSEEIRIQRGDGTTGFISVDASPIHDAAGTVVAGVVTFHDVTERKRREDDLAFLLHSSNVLGSSLDYEAALERVAGMAVPDFADWCAVHIVRENGTIEVLAAEHGDPEKREWARELTRAAPVDPDAPTGVPAVIRCGEPELVPELTDEAARDDDQLAILRRIGTRSYMCAPLVARGRILGALVFATVEGGRTYTSADLVVAEELARRSALAVDNARLYRAVEAERARLAAVTRSLAEGMYALDLTGRVIFVNPAAEAMLGWSEEELLGRDMHRMIHYRRLDGSAFPREECPLVSSLGTEQVVHGEEDAYVRKDGSMFHVSYTSSPIMADGVPVGSVLAFHDVSERRRAEEGMSLLVDASEVLGASLDYGSTLERLARISVPRLADCCVVDVVEQESEVRQVAVAAVDPRREELVRDLERRFPSDPGNPASPVGRVLSSGEPLVFNDLDSNLEAVARDADHLAGLRGLGLTSVMIVPLQARGQTLGALTFITLDSGRRYDADALRLVSELARRAGLAVDNARLYRDAEERGHAGQVLAAVGDGVFMLDDRECVRLWNPAAEAVTGIPAGEILGRPAGEAIPGWAAIAPLVPTSSAPGAPVRPETLPMELNGSELWLSIAGVGFSEGTVYAFRDLTDERRVETLKTEFVATASHELRTPLSAVYGAAMTLRRRDAVLDESLRERLLDVISEESDRLAKTVNDILWASRLEGGRLDLSDEAFEPVALAYQVIDAARTHLPAAVSIELVADEPLPLVAADSDKVRQVLTNLVVNAVKYSPDGGRVQVAIETRGRRLGVAVRDEGLGIPLHEQSRVFEKFYRLDPNLTRGVGGTGLGLYICRELIRHMGGRIWVASSEGEGSTFFFELPLAEDASEPD